MKRFIVLFITFLITITPFAIEGSAKSVITEAVITEDIPDSVFSNSASAETPPISPLMISEADQLRHSTLYGKWNTEYIKYNCYAFAIGYTAPEPGEDPWFRPGYFSSSSSPSLSHDTTIEKLALYTKYDLKALGSSCVIQRTDYDEIMQFANVCNIICLRKTSINNKFDFHYMKYSDSVWLHKPGRCHVLKLNGLPYETTWTNETLQANGIYVPGDNLYVGTIYYMAYKVNHNFTSRLYTGEEYHSGASHYFRCLDVCADCGDQVFGWEARRCFGPPCPLQLMKVEDEVYLSE